MASSMKAFSREDLERILSSIQESVECPVCLETAQVPFRHCVKGHIVCEECAKDLQKCPVCQELFSGDTSVCVKNLLQALPRRCRYSNDGCKLYCEPGDDHEQFCGFRPITCREASCDVTVPVCKLKEHYGIVHPKRFIVKKVEQNIKWPDFKPDENRYTCLPVFLFNNIFWIEIENDIEEKVLKLSFEATLDGKLSEDYYVRVTFDETPFSYVYTLKAKVLSEAVEIVDCNEKDTNVYCMKIPQPALINIVDKQNKLKWKLSFFKN